MAEAALSEPEAAFDRHRRRIGLVAAPLIFFGLWAAPLPLSAQAHALAAVAALVVTLWVTEAIPLAAAALLGPALAVLLGVTDPKTAFSAFGDPLIFLFLGGFLLASGLASQGFDRRAALWLIARPIIAGSPRRALIAVSAIAFVFSMWISNTATTAMMIPVALGLIDTMRRVLPDDPETLRKLKRYGGGMCLSLAYASSIGGSATPIGTGPNVIAVGMLRDMVGVSMGFGQWMSFALPSALAGGLLVVVVCSRAFPPPVERIEGLTAEVDRQLTELGPISPGERRAVAIFGLAILGWLAPSLLSLALGTEHAWTVWADATLNEGVVAIACSCLMFITGSKREPGARILDGNALQRLDWSTLLLLGGGLALGRLTFETKLAEAIGVGVVNLAGPIASHPIGLMAAATLLVIFLTEVTSNTATTAMMLPVLIGVAQAANFDPMPTAVIVTLAASYAFMLPVSTPPNAMAYGTRMIRIDTMMRIGIRLDLIGYAILMLVGVAIVPLVFG
ncbi:MAG: DASS family sodium-coupled anion symporter [Nannocystaceae bacterium]|nr:DASS family sodium-coupled anion symporter [Nannocystaceae bacterium]